VILAHFRVRHRGQERFEDTHYPPNPATPRPLSPVASFFSMRRLSASPIHAARPMPQPLRGVGRREMRITALRSVTVPHGPEGAGPFDVPCHCRLLARFPWTWTKVTGIGRKLPNSGPVIWPSPKHQLWPQNARGCARLSCPQPRTFRRRARRARRSTRQPRVVGDPTLDAPVAFQNGSLPRDALCGFGAVAKV